MKRANSFKIVMKLPHGLLDTSGDVLVTVFFFVCVCVL